MLLRFSRSFRYQAINQFRRFTTEVLERDQMEYDVVIVGAGPAGLCAAIKLKQLEEKTGFPVSVCVIEKGSEPGAHVLSGCCFDPIALNELFPNWKNDGAPIRQPVSTDKFLMFLGQEMALPSPTLPSLNAHGCYVVSLTQITKWLAEKAQELGVEIYPGFAASTPIYNEDGSVKGVQMGDMGISKNGERKENFTPGVELVGRQTIFAEGCRGSCTMKVMKKFNLNADAQPQTYGLGVKEVWTVRPENHQPGLVLHTGGWPLDMATYGGSFLYHAEDNKVYVGFVVGLDYENPYISVYDEFQRFKTHKAIRKTFEGGECIAYGARTITEGGVQCLPRLHMPGALLAGDNAGTLVTARIKGAHTAMKSGMLAAEAIMNKHEEIMSAPVGKNIELRNYDTLFKNSWVYEEMWKYRNFRPAVANYGFLIGSGIIAFDQFIARGKLPFTFKYKHHGDHVATKPAKNYSPIVYPKYDNKITFDLLSNLIKSGTHHEEDQPIHLHVEDKEGMKKDNWEKFAGPEGRFCPAKVYEWLPDEKNNMYLQINASNCLHCKACSIKDYGQRIEWRVPEGGGGPAYSEM